MPDGIYNSTKPKDSEPRTTTISFSFDVSSEDFYDRVCCAMALSRESAKLGWKGCDERKRDGFHRLETAEDLGGVFEMHRPMLLSTRRVKPVFVEISDLVCSTLSL